MKTLIAVIDDEEDIVELVRTNLEKAGFDTRGFHEATPFIKFLATKKPDLVVLDLMLPDMYGYEVCKYMRQHEQFLSIPIIMLTAKAEETDKIVGLELGADDYVTKPFSPKELVARVKAILRRKVGPEKKDVIDIDDILHIDLQKFEVLLKGKKIDLTTTEFKILHLLASKSGIVFSREQILNHLWGREKVVIDRTIDVHVKHLREKLGKWGESIKNIRGFGYKLDV